MTAADLFHALNHAGCGPAVDGADLVFDRDPPADLVPLLELLHTGVRAALTGRSWHGCNRRTGGSCGPYPARVDGPLAHGALDPAALLPASVGLLCVAGDAVWDRVPPSAPSALPAAFAPGPGRPR